MNRLLLFFWQKWKAHYVLHRKVKKKTSTPNKRGPQPHNEFSVTFLTNPPKKKRNFLLLKRVSRKSYVFLLLDFILCRGETSSLLCSPLHKMKSKPAEFIAIFRPANNQEVLFLFAKRMKIKIWFLKHYSVVKVSVVFFVNCGVWKQNDYVDKLKSKTFALWCSENFQKKRKINSKKHFAEKNSCNQKRRRHVVKDNKGACAPYYLLLIRVKLESSKLDFLKLAKETQALLLKSESG